MSSVQSTMLFICTLTKIILSWQTNKMYLNLTLLTHALAEFCLSNFYRSSFWGFIFSPNPQAYNDTCHKSESGYLWFSWVTCATETVVTRNCYLGTNTVPPFSEPFGERRVCRDVASPPLPKAKHWSEENLFAIASNNLYEISGHSWCINPICWNCCKFNLSTTLFFSESI